MAAESAATAPDGVEADTQADAEPTVESSEAADAWVGASLVAGAAAAAATAPASTKEASPPSEEVLEVLVVEEAVTEAEAAEAPEVKATETGEAPAPAPAPAQVAAQVAATATQAAQSEDAEVAWEESRVIEALAVARASVEAPVGKPMPKVPGRKSVVDGRVAAWNEALKAGSTPVRARSVSAARSKGIGPRPRSARRG